MRHDLLRMAAVVACLMGLAVTPAWAAERGEPAAATAMGSSPAGSPAAGRAVTELLINGDTITLPAPGPSLVQGGMLNGQARGLAGTLVSLRAGGRQYEIPAVALPYLGRGLDPSLFDVRALADAEHGGRLAVRVSYRGHLTALPGVTISRLRGGIAQGFLTARSAKRFGAALVRQYLADHTNASYGTDGLFADGLSVSRAGAPSGAARRAAAVGRAGAAGGRFALKRLTITGSDLAGHPDTGDVVLVYNADNSSLFDDWVESVGVFYHGVAKFSVPAGHYWAIGDFVDQPMMTLRYAVGGMGLDGSVAPGRQRLRLWTGHIQLADAAKVTHAAVQVSFDDGATWRHAVLGGRAGRFRAVYRAPATARYVSLRSTARDAAGGRITETLIRAYRIAPSRAAGSLRNPTMRAACAPRPGQARCLVLFAPQTRVNAAIVARAAGRPVSRAATTPKGWGAKDIEAAYKLPVSHDPHQTVAVVDAESTPHLASDLAFYRKHYGLPACTASPRPADLAAAEDTAARLGAQVISNSYGARESGFTQAYARAYRHPGHTVVVSSGDIGFTAANFPRIWPRSRPSAGPSSPGPAILAAGRRRPGTPMAGHPAVAAQRMSQLTAGQQRRAVAECRRDQCLRPADRRRVRARRQCRDSATRVRLPQPRPPV
jgi:hypothetical protein